MREVTPNELQELNNQSFKDTQKIFRRRLREIAAGGEIKARYKPDDYCCGDRIADWLKSLGFTIKQVNPVWYEITWPEEDVLEKLHRECLPILNSCLPDAARRAIDGLKIKGANKLGTWTKDTVQWDYVCSVCGKHSEYKTGFCCNCGKKMDTEEGENGT